MKMILKTTGIIILLWFLGSKSLHAQNDSSWDFVKKNKGVEVYSRVTEGSDVKEIKVSMVMHARLSALVSLMKDVGNHKNWVYANQYATVPESDGPFHWVFYGQSDAPWPVSDRDVISRAFLKQDSITKVIEHSSFAIPDYFPEKDGFVRIQELYSTWLLTPLNDGDVLVEFQLKVDMGGNIPVWLMNLAITKGPYKTILNMSRELEKPKYKNAMLDYIID